MVEILDFVAYCVVAVESAGRQLPIAFLERVKEEFSKKYGAGKAATASAKSLNREFGYPIFLHLQKKQIIFLYAVIRLFMSDTFFIIR